MSIFEKLLKIQTELNVPKKQFNKFGNYHFRSCEDILEEVKPFLKELNLTLIIKDEVVEFHQRYYIRAEAMLYDVDDQTSYTNIAYAREEENKKGMDAAQVTGATSSYARKYALNGLFCIDDVKDPDSNEYNKTGDTSNNTKVTQTTTANTSTPKLISEAQRKRLFAIANGNNDVIKRALIRYGYERTEQIKMSDYEKICTEVESEILM